MPADSQRLPSPYRLEAAVVAERLQALQGALDWPAAARTAAPWVEAVRRHPPPFWAMESLLKEYPISSAEGLALMRLAEALLRVPDVETAVALTADQLSRADFEGAADRALARLSHAAIALSKRFLPADGTQREGGLLARLGARTVVAAALRAVQLLGRQFVLGQSIAAAMAEAGAARQRQPGLRFSYDMLGEGARTAADAQRYLAHYEEAIAAIAAAAAPSGPVQDNDGISIKLSALHPRYEALQHARVMDELVPRVWGLCRRAADANINLTIDAEEVDRLELSLDVFEALGARVAAECPQWQGFGLALQAYQTRALELVAEVAAIARRHGIRLMCRLVKGAYWDAEIKRAQELGLAHYPVFTHKHHTDVSYLACAQALLAAQDVIYPQFATHNAGTIAAIVQMAQASGAPFELQRLHGMGEGVFRELSRNTPPVQDGLPPPSLPREGEEQDRFPCGSMRRWGATATCSPTWCAACWKTARIRPSCTSSPTLRCRWTSFCPPRSISRRNPRCRCRRTCTARGGATARAWTSRCRRCARRSRRRSPRPPCRRWRRRTRPLHRPPSTARWPPGPHGTAGPWNTARRSCAAPPTPSRRSCPGWPPCW